MSNANKTTWHMQINCLCDWYCFIVFEILIDRWNKSRRINMAVKGKDIFMHENTHRIELLIFLLLLSFKGARVKISCTIE